MLGMRKEIFTTQDEIVTKEKVLAYLEKQKDLDKMIVVSPEVWDNAITDAYENGKRDSEKQKEQKPAEWSEEDEEILKLLILNIGRYMYFGGMSSERILSWLKSLRPQYHGDVTMTEAYKMGKEAGEASHWKPSEEQMAMLLAVINEPNNAGAESCHLALKSIYEQLKKL